MAWIALGVLGWLVTATGVALLLSRAIAAAEAARDDEALID